MRLSRPSANFSTARCAWDAILIRMDYIGDMTTYTIIPTPDGSGFNIGIAGSNGARQTMLGFTSEAEAEAWINQDKRRDGTPQSHASSQAASPPG
ncbi:MAG TPA: hypothetical protein VGC82_10260 [Rhodopila sp.]|jgi:hypothetical protein